ncbi:lipocalin-like domain-containing protein [Luteithermobacter gelatinilyticus]|uniref:lipocalin-like domain-containing protein n=1 Tax=Luteithermobacter gelatinilyticus TaxID=2582913 RepID=UPI0011075972|nr:lipocalin-like domain-containing protein [Luteithermobacter gelatinilyticus]
MTPSLENPLVGTWHLLEWKISYSDDRPDSYPYGPDAIGILVYTEDGYMSANISAAHRPRLSGGSLRRATPEEKIAAFESNFSYAGPYRINGQTVTHTVQHALNPNMLGTEQVRQMAFQDNKLTLSANEVLPETDLIRHHRLIWFKK